MMNRGAGRERGGSLPGLALLVLFMVAALVCAVMLLDPWDWLTEKEGAAAVVSAFPGVEEPDLQSSVEPVSPDPFNVLILGLDHGLGRPVQGYERSDVVIVAHIDEANGRACLLSIPRDSYVEIPGNGKARINEAYQDGGPDLAVQTVELATGMKIRNYLVVDFDEFRWLVDLFGGVQVTLDEPLLDPKLGAIPSGSQILDGDLALVMARSRNYSSGDLERVRQQQRLLIQILYKGKQLAQYPGAAWFLSVALEPLETNINRDEVIRLAREFGAFPAVDVQGGVMPGSPNMIGGASVYLIDAVKAGELVTAIEASCSVPLEFR